MPNPTIYIKQKYLDEFEKKCNQLIKSVNEEKTALLLKQARFVRDRIKEKAPLGPPTDKKPGSLKAATYAVAYPPTTSSPAVAFAGIRPKKASHAHLVEYGHGGPHPAPPHPFVRPAWDETKEQVKKNIETGLKKTVEAAV